MNETYCINALIFYHKLSLRSSGSSEDWLLDGEPGPKGQNTSDRQGSSPRTPTQGEQGRPKGGVRFNQERWSSGKSMVMRQVRGQARQSGQDQVWWGSDTTQWLPGMHSDEATLRSSQEDSPQVRVQINGGHGRAQARLWRAEDRHTSNELEREWRLRPKLKWISLAHGQRGEASHEAGQGH